MKNAISLLLALALCLSLCACGSGDGSSKTQNTTNNTIITESETTPNTNGDIVTPIVYDHTLTHPLADSLLGEWLIDDALSGCVMPVKIVFKDNGTCVVEYLEESKADGFNYPTEYNWGIVPDCIGNDADLYVRIGTEGKLWYLFWLKDTGVTVIAVHSTDPVEGGFLIDGLTQDGYKGMWFHMKKNEISVHPLVQEICGKWETNMDEAPFKSMLINADGTCVVDGVHAVWQVEESFTKDGFLSIYVFANGEACYGMLYASNTGVSTLTKPNGNGNSPLFLPCEAYKES